MVFWRGVIGEWKYCDVYAVICEDEGGVGGCELGGRHFDCICLGGGELIVVGSCDEMPITFLERTWRTSSRFLCWGCWLGGFEALNVR